MPKPKKKIRTLEQLENMDLKDLANSPDANWRKYWHDIENDVAFVTTTKREADECESNMRCVRITAEEYYRDFNAEHNEEVERELTDVFDFMNDVDRDGLKD